MRITESNEPGMNSNIVLFEPLFITQPGNLRKKETERDKGKDCERKTIKKEEDKDKRGRLEKERNTGKDKEKRS